jgi:hypothetical protein
MEWWQPKKLDLAPPVIRKKESRQVDMLLVWTILSIDYPELPDQSCVRWLSLIPFDHFEGAILILYEYKVRAWWRRLFQAHSSTLSSSSQKKKNL